MFCAVTFDFASNNTLFLYHRFRYNIFNGLIYTIHSNIILYHEGLKEGEACLMAIHNCAPGPIAILYYNKELVIFPRSYIAYALSNRMYRKIIVYIKFT